MKIKFLTACFIIGFLGITGILAFTKTELTAENATYHKNYEKIYPPGCFINFENKKYLIREIYKYKHKLLSEYSFIASEGFATQKFVFPFEMNYNNELRKNIILRYSRNTAFVKFNSRQYQINEKRTDTLISKISDNELILFIEK